jgi:hypothetical protein
MRPLCLALLALAACSSPPEASGDPGSVTGTVASVDLTPLSYDGDAVITLETDDGETARVLVAARMNLCAAAGLGLVGDLLPGDRIEVVGEATDEGVRPCAEAEHRIVRASAASGGGGEWEGYYFSAFETSSFRPCGEDESWWLTPNSEFNQRYLALQEDDAAPRGRTLGPHVRVRFEGDRSERGLHGHLGAYPYEIRVTRLLEIEVVAPGDGEWPDVVCDP